MIYLVVTVPRDHHLLNLLQIWVLVPVVSWTGLVILISVILVLSLINRKRKKTKAGIISNKQRHSKKKRDKKQSKISSFKRQRKETNGMTPSKDFKAELMTGSEYRAHKAIRTRCLVTYSRRKSMLKYLSVLYTPFFGKETLGKLLAWTS